MRLFRFVNRCFLANHKVRLFSVFQNRIKLCCLFQPSRLKLLRRTNRLCRLYRNSFFFPAKRNLRNQIFSGESLLYRMINRIIDTLRIRKPHLKLGRMHIYIQSRRIHRQMKHRKRIFMLHHIWAEGFFNRLTDYIIPDISSVNEIVFKVPVAPCNDRLSDKAPHRYVCTFLKMTDLRKI